MDIFVFGLHTPVRRLSETENIAMDSHDLLWLDFSRAETHWYDEVKKRFQIEIHERHILDSFNPTHTPYFNSLSNYDMLVFQTYSHLNAKGTIELHSVVFFLFENVLITVRSAECHSTDWFRKKLLDNHNYKNLLHPEDLMYHILNMMVDQLLALREPFSDRLDAWRSELFKRDFNDWSLLFEYKRELRKLESLCEQQTDALMEWRENSRSEIDELLEIRYRDLSEHIQRVSRNTINLQSEIEYLTQLQFSISAQRTNEVMRFLTLVSAIFLPLNLIAGIFGMNFEDLPLIHTHGGSLSALIGMFSLAVTLVILFRFKHWL